MLNFRDDRVYNQWRHTPVWPIVGWGAVSVPSPIAVVWAVTIIIPPHAFSIPVAITLLYVTSRMLRVPLRRFVPYLLHRLRGRRYSGMSPRFMRSLFGCLLAAVLLPWAPGAHADFRLVVPASAGNSGGSPAGHPQSLDAVIQGYGHGMRLKDAVNAIIPGSWKADFSSKHLADKKVDWVSRHRTVRQVLAYLSNESDAQYKVDNGAGVIHFSALPRGYLMTAHGVVKSNKPYTFTLRAGHMLKPELARWARAAGWRVGNWPAMYAREDYAIKADASFQGPFMHAVTALVRAYQEQGGLAGIVPRFATSNHVVSFDLMR